MFNDLGFRTCDADLDALRRLAWEANLHGPADIFAGSESIAVEIGSWAGRSAEAIAWSMVPSPWKVFCIDTWQGAESNPMRLLYRIHGETTALDTFCQNVAGLLFEQLFPLVGRSEDWAKRWPERPIDLLFIDGDHSIDAVKQDHELWTPHVRPGGIICGHDANEPGVRGALDFLEIEREIVGKSVWWYRKP